jgi:HSP20 family molecular chaperone IbpA
MSLFPRSFYGPDPSFTPLFRLLDDFDNYSRELQGSQQEGGRHRHHRARFFNPKFDVRETDTAYELHGELPGIERENVQIEFTDPQTIVIRGRVERSYSSGTPPAGFVEGEMSGAITESGETNGGKSRKATVSDEPTKEAKEKGTPAESTEVAKQEEKPQAPADKYWVSERSVGEFSRTFSFPSRVDQDAVSANLNNGILAITVPKAKKHETRRIAVN